MKNFRAILVLLTTLILSNFSSADDKGFSIGMKPTLYSFNIDETNASGLGVTYLMGYRSHDNISFRTELGLGNAIYDADKYNTDQTISADYLAGYLVIQENANFIYFMGKFGATLLTISDDFDNVTPKSDGNIHFGLGLGLGLKATQSLSLEAELNFISPELTTTSLGLFYIF